MTSTLTRTAAALAVAALPVIAGGTAAQAGTDPYPNHHRDKGRDYCRDHQRDDHKRDDYKRTDGRHDDSRRLDERTRGSGYDDPPARMTIPRYGDTSHHKGDWRDDNCQTHRPPQHRPPQHHHHHKRHHRVQADPWNEVRTATAAFFSVAAAERAGYARPPAPAPLHYCIAKDPKSNKAPAMGFHWINMKLVDATVEATKPEALVYEPNKDGKLDFVAVEYVVPKAAWDAAGNITPPKLNGVEFMLTTSPNRYNIPAFYSLHAWIWKSNPDGVNEPFNPRVSCVYAGLIK
ncbi:hypothetical protein [Phycicoccus sp. SLBN-51]|uniref:hypothetical protein n=1 Tax=Phycicoccus sp. SLBN-51 TaxID=2768447 RepID=UPI00116C4B08|nr:hypothetical protein [Phycicoccus sp. SLBN-51]TQJ50183.1 hypothetical protein FBY26_1883 [Phycicoccus sp. SLBN-51]